MPILDIVLIKPLLTALMKFATAVVIGLSVRFSSPRSDHARCTVLSKAKIGVDRLRAVADQQRQSDALPGVRRTPTTSPTLGARAVCG